MSFYGSTTESDLYNMEEGAMEDQAEDANPLLPYSEEPFEEVITEPSIKGPNAPTLAPLGKRLKRNAQVEYNPYDWRSTLFVVRRRAYISRSFYVVGLIGSALVVMSGIAGIGLQDDRECRAWCSRFALGTQPHQYMGFILFLIMAFRNNEAYRMYQAGLQAHFRFKEALRRFVDTVLNRVPRDAITHEQRARIVAFAVAFPYAVTADLREERFYDKNTIENLLSPEDLEELKKAPTMPLFVLESLVAMVHKYCEPVCTNMALRTMYNCLESLYRPYGECERIKNNPCAFAYVAHLRFLLVAYLITLPLAMVEQMGWSTIPVCWVICYSLMSLEMLAVEVENPFGHGASDLRLHEYNLQIKESLLETWKRWRNNLEEQVGCEKLLAKYAGLEMPEVHTKWFYW